MNSLQLRSLLIFTSGVFVYAQHPAPKAPFTAKDLEFGKQLVATSAEVRTQIKDGRAPVEPFKIMGNLYFVGIGNGEAYLLTSPQGHILFGAGYPDTVEQVQKNIEAMGFKLTDIKAILLNHNHVDQSGGAAALKQKTGAQVVAGFAEVPFIEHGQHNGSPIPNFPPPLPGQDKGKGGGGGGPTYPPVKVDRALFDGDVVKVGSLSVTAYLAPGHSPSSTSWLYTVRDGGRDYRVFEFCCWEYPDDITRNPYITKGSVRHNLEMFRKVLPIDIYLELGMYGWGGTLNQPSGTLMERLAKLRTDNKLFVNPQIFRGLSAARELEFEEKVAKLRATKE